MLNGMEHVSKVSIGHTSRNRRHQPPYATTPVGFCSSMLEGVHPSSTYLLSCSSSVHQGHPHGSIGDGGPCQTCPLQLLLPLWCADCSSVLTAVPCSCRGSTSPSLMRILRYDLSCWRMSCRTDMSVQSSRQHLLSYSAAITVPNWLQVTQLSALRHFWCTLTSNWQALCTMYSPCLHAQQSTPRCSSSQCPAVQTSPNSY